MCDYGGNWDMERSELKEKLLGIVEEAMPQLEAKDVQTDLPLEEEYDVDSVSLIKIIVDAETMFGVKFDDKELALNKYENFDDMIDTIAQKMQA